MLRSSKRSTSTPRMHGGKRSATPRRQKDVERPAWDDTNGDLAKYKATPEQIARRKTQRVSKNMVNISNLHASGMSPEPSSDDVITSLTVPSPPGHSGTHATSTPEPANSPAIDYSAVLKLLQKPATPPTASTPPKTTDDAAHARNDDIRCTDQAQPPDHWAGTASTEADSSNPAPRIGQHVLSSSDEMLDATMGAFSRLDMACTPSHTVTTTNRPQDNAAPRPSSSLVAPALALLSGGTAPSMNSGSVPGPVNHAGSQQVHDWLQVTAGRGVDSTAVAAVQNRQQQLESQVSRLEAALQQLNTRQQQQDQHHHHSAHVNVGLQALKQSTSQLQAEQSQLRAELSEFTQHAGSMISKLQAQLHQLLRTTVGGVGVGTGPPTPAMSIGDSQATGWPWASGAPTNVLQSSMAPQPSRNLFMDLPPSQPTTWNPSARPQPGNQSQQHQRRASPTSPTTGQSRRGTSAIPVTNFDEQLALPSYAAMRKSTASGVTTFTPNRKASTTTAPTPININTASASAPGSLPTDDSQSQQRSLPTQYLPRALGTSPILAQGLSSNSTTATDMLVQGFQLPTTRLGEAQVGSSSDYSVTATSGAAFRGTSTAFGVLPEPMVFNMASDFKIVRVGGSGGGVGGGGAIPLSSALTPENSLSLAAHTAAAMRSKAARGG